MLKDLFKEMFEGPTVNEAQETKKSFSKEESAKLATDQGYKGDAQEFAWGMDIELEHGTVTPATNVTNDDPVATAKIALAHLNEIPDYYTRLRELEKQGKAALKSALKSGRAEVGAEVPNSLPDKHLPGGEKEIIDVELKENWRKNEDYDPNDPGIPDEQTDNLGTGTKTDEALVSKGCDVVREDGVYKIRYQGQEIGSTHDSTKIGDIIDRFMTGEEAPADEAKINERTTSDFKVGDKVEIQYDVDWTKEGKDLPKAGDIGTVARIDTDGIGVRLYTMRDNVWSVFYFEPDELVKKLSEATHGEVPFDTFDKRLDKAIEEDRYITYASKLLYEIKLEGLKRLDAWTTANGAVGLYRYEYDKNAYEIEIRPIQTGKYKSLWGKRIK